jgi:hypothetical protein
MLEPYHASIILRKIHDPLPPIEVNSEQKYEVGVGDILNSRISNRQLQYLIHWNWYDVNGRTWEPIKIWSNAMETVHKFD